MSLLHAVGAGGAGAGVLYPEDVFSTYLYTGNGSTQTINNGIDLAGKGGLVWIKRRSTTGNNEIYNTSFGIAKLHKTNTTDAVSGDGSTGHDLSGFLSNGFALGSDWYAGSNTNGDKFASWTFRKAPKFFDVVTYTGDGVAGRQISHNLGCRPGWVIIKATSSTSDWAMSANWNADISNGGYSTGLSINSTANAWSDSASASIHTSTAINLTYVNPAGSMTQMNELGVTYVAYLFAHDPSADGIIQCGSFTETGSGATITLGWEPQYFLYKCVNSTGDWVVHDSMRGFPLGSSSQAQLYPNLSNTETPGEAIPSTSATGVSIRAGAGTYIYLAIRRPMKVPTSGTEVFQPVVYTGTNTDYRLVDTTIAPDMVMVRERNDTTPLGMAVASRLTGNARLQTGSANVEIDDADSFMRPTVGYGSSFSAMNGFGVGNDGTCKVNLDTTANNHIALAFKRARGFFDVVCYTGTGVADRTVNHNLGVVPELMIVKGRSTAGHNWIVYHSSLGATISGVFAVDIPIATAAWGNTEPTDTVFTTGAYVWTNASSSTYVAYLFASLVNVSKCFSYTGNGTSLNVECGFSTGARFVLCKRTDSTGDWFVFDSVRGITASNDPHLSLNTTAAEVTTDDPIDPYANGFTVNQNTTTNLNVNGGTYIGLAIA